MAFKKVIALAMFSAVALAAPAPQYLTQLQPINSGNLVNLNGIQTLRSTLPFATQNVVTQSHQVAQPSLLRTVAAQPVVHTVTHNSPSIVRTVSHASPVVHTVAQPSVVRTVAAQPLVHTVAQPSVFRTVAQPTAIHTVAQPTVVRTVAQPALVHEQAHAQYNFGYSVSDAASGDNKQRQESRDGDVVTGSYSVADPDGRIRHVEYSADAVNGFQAHVTYDGAEGPVAIPFDAPSSANIVSVQSSPASSSSVFEVARSVLNNDNDEEEVIEVEEAGDDGEPEEEEVLTRTSSIAQPTTTILRNNNFGLFQPANQAFLTNGFRTLGTQTLVNANGQLVANGGNSILRLSNGGFLRNNGLVLANNGAVLANIDGSGAIVRTVPTTVGIPH